MSTYSYISNAHPAFIEALYKDYVSQTGTVDAYWQKFFEGFDYALKNSSALSQNGADNGQPVSVSAESVDVQTELKVYALITAFRNKGHLESKTNPIKPRKNRFAHLALSDFGLQEADLDKTFYVGSEIGLPNSTLREITGRLKTVYCGSLGFEYTYITNPEQLAWLKSKIEGMKNNFGFSIDQKRRMLQKLNDSAVFEEFLHRKYQGEKRFSLEGGETTIPALDAIINSAGGFGVEEVVIGMAHRGRLNVLANIMQKTYEQIFSEFENTLPDDLTMGDGDVKYHLGYSSLVKTPEGKQLHIKLAPNPSHLEAVNPVVEGFTRAKADVIYNSDYSRILPVIVHGDAAVAGQGVVYEVLQMSKLAGYQTGGTVHFVINNQVGFTTDFDDARSSDYCTSLAAMVKAPVIHVNGDDVEAVVFAAILAVEYRHKFNNDVFIDMVCYRKYGHNEGDDPKFTQPFMYEIIEKHPSVRKIYSQQLNVKGEIEAALAEQMEKAFWTQLQERLDMVKQKPLAYKYQEPELAWKALRKATPADFEKSPVTGISTEQVNLLIEGLGKLPEGFQPTVKAQKMIKERALGIKEKQILDWGAAELFSYGSILLEGKHVRMSGEDVKRSTFSHRHAVVYDRTQEGKSYNRLNHIIPDQKGRFLIYNSLLSEYAVLGFEYGYAMASPENLVLWEAQFGDFVNGAQIVIDQFVSAAESKWQRMNGLVMLLPHGYEGQGPEHSSARLERFLQACAEQNICVVNITEPANLFHVFRRQLSWPFRKPLVIMSPKSLLRSAQSPVSDITGNTCFREIIDDPFVKSPKKVKKLLLCSGKVYYDLANKQQTENITDIAIVRLEQLYPLSRTQIAGILEKYKNAQVCWVQEEPANMGALWHIKHRLPDVIAGYVARKESASPATGFKKQHEKEQKELIDRAFSLT
ncbi:MAG: 2-oxoglutarate dehydrogenase E1 component [Sphingobacteriales bacterium]|nr:MAG: 2-oxoglutarate dehydrogenase E1 component [Sphingobacteriales bacterium]